jgi:hypothetical protein
MPNHGVFPQPLPAGCTEGLPALSDFAAHRGAKLAPGGSQCPIAAVVSVISLGGEAPGGLAAATMSSSFAQCELFNPHPGINHVGFQQKVFIPAEHLPIS